MTQIATIAFDRIDDVPLARVSGEIDTSNAAALLDQIVSAVSNGWRGVILDLTAVTYMDSAGIHLVFQLDRRLRERRQQLLVVCPASSRIHRVLTMTKMDRAIPMAGSASDALAALSAGVG